MMSFVIKADGVMHQLAEFIAPSRLGRNFRWLLASS
jgi:hypothetical protein